MSILDTACIVAKETTYATAVSPTRGYEAHADGWKIDQNQLDSNGFRPGIQTTRKDRSRVVNLGGEGNIECDVLSSTMGVLLDAGFGATTGPATVQTTGKQYVFTTTSAEPATSLTVQMLKAKIDGGTDCYQYAGAVAKNFKLSQDVGSLLMCSLDFDAAVVSLGATAGTPVYAAAGAASPFAWTDATLTVNSASVDATSFEFNIDHTLKTDRQYLRGTAQKKRPRRNGMPAMTTSFSLAYVDNSIQALRVAGTIVPVSIVWTSGTLIGAGPATFKIQLDLAACQFTDGDAEESLSDQPKQDMSLRVLDPGDGTAAATLTYTTSDAAL